MSVTIRNYTNEVGFTEDFHKVCEFLDRINHENVITPNYWWASRGYAFPILPTEKQFYIKEE